MVDRGISIKTPIDESIVVKDGLRMHLRILLNPADFDVIATLNLNGDYISDALARKWAESVSHRAPILARSALLEATHGQHLALRGRIN